VSKFVNEIRPSSKGTIMAASQPEIRDARIVQIIQELSNQLGIEKFPRTIVWTNELPGGRSRTVVGSDESFVWDSQLVLAKRMQDALGPDEWRPIIASSLILSSKLRKNVLKKIFIRLILPPALPFALSIFLFASGFNSAGVYVGPTWIVLFFVASLFTLMIIPGFLFGDYYQEAKLVADRQVADLVGRQRFLDILWKIDGMDWDDVEQAKGRHHGAPRLGLDRRIGNLRDYSK